MKAVILAGGRGLDLFPLTQTRPKPMITLLGKPILEYLIRELKEVGLREILIVTGYKGEQITDVRISVGPSGPVPRRMTQAEDVLRGNPPTEDKLASAFAAILDQASFRTSRHRATSEYRQHVVGVLLAETLHTAFERAYV